MAMHDPKTEQGGINHFMLPGNISRNYYQTDIGKYGIHAMELLFNAMLKKGCGKDRLVVKVFGGGTILPSRISDGKPSIAQDNIKFALHFLETEGFHVSSCDVGGTHARKVIFFPDTGRVLLKRLKGSFIQPIRQEETDYRETIKQDLGKGGDFISFRDAPMPRPFRK